MLRTSQMLSREVQESMDTVLLGEEFVRYCEAHGIVHEKLRRRGAHRMDVDVSHRRNGQTATRVAPTHVKASVTLTAKTRRATQWLTRTTMGVIRVEEEGSNEVHRLDIGLATRT